MSLFDALTLRGPAKLRAYVTCNKCNMGGTLCDDFYMHVAPWAFDPAEPAEKLPAALDDATVAAQRAAVRGILVARLEALHGIAGDEVESGKDRVRWAELQVRIIDRLMKLWKLESPDVPAAGDDDDTAGMEQQRLRDAVALQLDELADRAE